MLIYVYSHRPNCGEKSRHSHNTESLEQHKNAVLSSTFVPNFSISDLLYYDKFSKIELEKFTEIVAFIWHAYMRTSSFCQVSKQGYIVKIMEKSKKPISSGIIVFLCLVIKKKCMNQRRASENDILTTF